MLIVYKTVYYYLYIQQLYVYLPKIIYEKSKAFLRMWKYTKF